MEKSGDSMKAPMLNVATPMKATVAREESPWSTASTAATGSSGVSPQVSPQNKDAARRIHFCDSSEELHLDGSLDVSLDVEAAGVSTAHEVVTVPAQKTSRPYCESFFVNMTMFCGYASLFGLQHEVKSVLNISDDDIQRSRAFGVACSFLYIFNLIFRFSHNVVFGFTGPRGRAFIAMASMMTSMTCIAGPIFYFQLDHMGWVTVAYALGGVAMGTFEANFLCCLTPLGPEIKHVAITAIPIGVTTVLVGGFFAMGPPFNVSAMTLYVTVAVGVCIGMLVFSLRIPHIEIASQPGLGRFVAEAKQWREWLPLVWHLPIATAIDMFTLSAFSPGVSLYIWDQATVTVLPGLVLPTHTFFAIYNVFNCLGGLLGRAVSYKLKPRHPLVYALFSLFGASLILCKVAWLAPLSTFLVMVGDGLIYGTIARRIDKSVPKEFNLIALSYWLFVGDFGSVIGSNLISYIRVWVVG